MVKMIGSINCYIQTKAYYQGKMFFYNGTTLNLVQCLVKLGAMPGDLFKDDQDRIRKVLSSGGGDREGTNGYWVTQFNPDC
jgi:hypothetical protein